MHKSVETPNHAEDNSRRDTETRQPTDTLADVLEQASILRGALRDALSATGDLIRSLKRDKKRRRAFESTLASLRQLERTGA